MTSTLARLSRHLPAVVRNPLRDHVAPVLLGTTTPRVRAIEARLWGGFSALALSEIDELLTDPVARRRQQSEAARVRAVWRAMNGDLTAAIADIGDARARHSPAARDPDLILLEAHFRARAGDGAGARERLDALPRETAVSASAALVRANSHNPALLGRRGSEDAMLRSLAPVFARAGVAGIAPREPAHPLSLDNLTTDTAVAPASCDARVTVIVPLYNGARVLPTALAGLAAQSWTDLEVLIVDDASQDESADIAAAFSARDPRFRLIRMPENRGGYAARNRALTEATGVLVTTHDADDWSHPDKIRLQVAHLRARNLPFSLAAHVRAGTDLVFHGPARPVPRLVARNFSSLLAPRALIERMGGWDPVRVGADSEMLHRLEHLHRTGRIAAVLPDCPLSFSRTGAATLTADGPTRLATFYHGVRREYHEARRHWHRSLDRNRAPGTPPEATVPPMIRARRGARAPVDLLVIGDLHRHDPRAFVGAATRAALFHYPDALGDVARPLDGALRDFALTRDIPVIAPGEKLAARRVLILDPGVFSHAMDRFPQVDAGSVLVRATTAPPDAEALKAALRACLGTEGIWLIRADAEPQAVAARLASP